MLNVASKATRLARLHNCSTSAITWLESTTATPEATNRCRMVRRRNRVDGLERLVEHKQPGRVQERHRKADLLAHTRGTVDDKSALGLKQLEHAEQFVHPLRDRDGVDPAQLTEIRDR